MDTTQNPLQAMFEAAAQKQLNETVLSGAVCKLFERYGIQLSTIQKAALGREIRSGSVNTVNVGLTKRQRQLLGKNKLDPTSLDKATLESIQLEAWSNLQPKLPSSLLAIADSIATHFEREIKKKAKVELRARRTEQAMFEKRLKRRWMRPLDLLQTLVFIAVEAGQNASVQLGSRRQHTIQVILRLHARACQVAHEIVALLQSGFADGAHARWRTLHELTVTGFFIAEHGDPTAERFVLHHGIETFKAAEQFQKYCQRLGFRSLTKRKFSDIAKRKERLIKRFGKSFNGDYGWAASIIQKDRPTFRDIEEMVQLDYIRPYYKLACSNVHAGAKGAFERLGLYKDNSNVLLAGPSSIGLADPGQAAALSLSQITTCLLLAEPTLDSFVVIRLVDRLAKQVGRVFLEAQKAAEATAASSRDCREPDKPAKAGEVARQRAHLA
jgi:hypothetical protein